MADGRVQPEGVVEIRDGEIERSLLRPREPPVTERVGVGRLFADRAVEVGDRAINLAHLEKDDAAVVIGMGVVRVQSNRLVVIAHGALDLVARAKRIAPIVERVGRPRVQTNRLVVIADGPIEVSDAPVGNPPVYERPVVVRIQKNDCRARANRGGRGVGKTLTPRVGLRARIDRSDDTNNCKDWNAGRHSTAEYDRRRRRVSTATVRFTVSCEHRMQIQNAVLARDRCVRVLAQFAGFYSLCPLPSALCSLLYCDFPLAVTGHTASTLSFRTP